MLCGLLSMLTSVALRKESVDRNRPLVLRLIIGYIVALRKESVDRNGDYRDDVSN